jgi:predicted permease
VKLLNGRSFQESDDLGKRHVMIINREFARQFLPGENPIGKMIGDTDLHPQSMAEVVGVVENLREGPLDAQIWPAVYFPYNQNPDTMLSLLVRTAGDEQALLPELASTVKSIDRGIVTRDGSTMARRIAQSPSAYLQRSSAFIVGGFAAFALLLGVIGLYGAIAYSVSQRTREIGIRMALGADRAYVYRMILKEAGWLTLFGILIGLAMAAALGVLLKTLLFGVKPWDAPTFAAVAILLATASILASFVPARRAAAVNPMQALRAE